jgi:prephenate dehydrogenase
MGGSIALAAKERGLAASVCLWARSEERAKEISGVAKGVLVSTNLAEVLQGANLVVLATPVGAMRGLAERIVQEGGLSRDAVVTDVGSVKGLVDAEIRPLLEAGGLTFVGSHPMAGSEQTGWSNALPDLYEGAVCVVTPAAETDPAATAKVEALWEGLGCRLFRMNPEEHDRAVARISHFPHLAAAALVHAALKDDPTVAAVCGSGFRDSSRVASGSPGMWTEILLENRSEVVETLRRMSGVLGEVLEILEKMDDESLHRFLEEAKTLRDSSLQNRSSK